MVQTGISLNERFTQMQSRQQQPPAAARGRRSRSRSRSRRIVDATASVANSRLLQEFKRKHTVQTALKLKRRSLRTTAGGANARLGGIKALRLGANGKPVRLNNGTRLATMRADLIANNGRARRSNSSSARRSSSAVRGLGQRLGLRRPVVGGAAERVAQRRRGLSRQQQQQPLPQLQSRGRSRSRGRARSLSRGRDQSRGRSQSVGRTQSRGRRQLSANGGRGVSAGGGGGRAPGRVSVKQRLGVRPGVAAAAAAAAKGAANKRRGNRRGNSQVRGVTAGRIEKRRNSNTAQKTVIAAAGGRGRKGRARGRSAVRAAAAVGAASAATNRSRSRSRSRSRARQGKVAASAAASSNGRQKGAGPVGARRRGRSLQRTGGKVAKGANINGNKKKNNSTEAVKPNQLQQGRRGRSRGRGGRTVAGKPQRREVKREDLDNELDQYMSTTKSEMDFLLK
ncbi:serine/arginine-rich splicing factor 4 [Drosophila montana]|uniref:serine/arginine-rich splicing factor 4 n=1 Tax=Drosophila montana TaxID=40370 RepID=UPI00313C9298